MELLSAVDGVATACTVLLSSEASPAIALFVDVSVRMRPYLEGISVGNHEVNGGALRDIAGLRSFCVAILSVERNEEHANCLVATLVIEIDIDSEGASEMLLDVDFVHVLINGDNCTIVCSH